MDIGELDRRGLCVHRYLYLQLVYRNSGEWTLGSWMEKRFMCVQIFVPSAALQKQLLVCKISLPSAAVQKQ